MLLVNAGEFGQAVKLASKLLGSSQQKNSNEFIQIKPENDALLVGALDKQHSVWTKVEAKGAVAGEHFGVPALLKQLITTMPQDDIDIEFDNKFVRFFFGPSSEAQLAIARDLPSAFEITGVDWHTSFIPAEELRRGLGVMYAAATENFRGVVANILLDSADGKLRFVATDGHRAAVELTSGEALVTPVLIPRQVAAFMRALLPKEGTVALRQNGNYQVAVDVGNIRYTGLCAVWSEYVKYQRFLEMKAKAAFVVKRHELLDALYRMIIIARGETHRKVTLIPSEGVLQLTVNTGTDAATETLAIENFSYADDTFIVDGVSLNAKYLYEALENLTHDKVLVRLTDKYMPLLLHGVDSRAVVATLKV